MPEMFAASPEEVHALFIAAFNSRDIDSLVSLYEPDAVFVTGAGPIAGHDAIREILQVFFEGHPKLSMTTRSVVAGGDIALLQGEWTLAGVGPSGEPVTSQGRSGEVIRKQADGRWLFAIDQPNL